MLMSLLLLLSTAFAQGADAEADNSYLKALRAPLPQIRLMPTGGVNLDTASSFLKAGACALGIGGSLVEKSLPFKFSSSRSP